MQRHDEAALTGEAVESAKSRSAVLAVATGAV